MVHRNKILFGSLVACIFLAIGTTGYALIENYTVLDAFYMTVITITTVGYGEVHSLSEAGKIFTIFLILFGFGSIGFLAHAFTEAIVERAASGKLGRKSVQQKINQLQNHVIICGFGRVGEAAAEHFASSGHQFVVIESGKEQLKILEQYNYIYLESDATREDALLTAGIKRASSLVALLDSDPENLFTVLTARELNPTLHIIARTEVATSESRMLRAGADSIVSPYAYAGRKVAQTILESVTFHPEKDTGSTSLEPAWLIVDEQSDLAGHAVETAEIFLGAKIIGLRRDTKDRLFPHHEEQIILGDRILVIPSCPNCLEEPDITRSRKKIIFIDDNPVILRLYTRLFQKAGFYPITASKGEEGYELILRERPDAVIVDYELPDISGLEICRRIRDDKNRNNLKLFLFTSHDDEETRSTALQSGVDTVVIKSPEATEIVNIVKKELED